MRTVLLCRQQPFPQVNTNYCQERFIQTSSFFRGVQREWVCIQHLLPFGELVERLSFGLPHLTSVGSQLRVPRGSEEQIKLVVAFSSWCNDLSSHGVTNSQDGSLLPALVLADCVNCCCWRDY